MTLVWPLISRCVVVVIAGLLALPFGPAGCSDDTAKASPRGIDAACPSGEVKSPEGECACPAATVPGAAGGCQPAGLPLDMPCLPGEMLLPEGGCEPAGVAPEACGQGFEPDGKRGCNAILPEEDCPEGLMAIPGEMTCREVASCGSGTWGDIPVEANTEHVDRSYSGGDSDGTKEKPWTTVQAGINAAEEGAIVAVAAGSYKESLQINHKRVRLWGRCPSMVVVEGVKEKQYALVLYFSDGTEVRGLAIRGPAVGLVTVGSLDVVANQIWIHHTGGYGAYIDYSSGPANLTVSSSLIEASAWASLYSVGASLTLSGSVVRDTVSPATSIGVAVLDYKGEYGDLKILASIISRTHRYGVYAVNSSVQIESTLIRDIQPNADGTEGQGIYTILDWNVGASVDLAIRASVIEDTRAFGVAVSGPDLTIESTVIRRTRPDEFGGFGRGINFALGEDDARGSMTIRGSLVEDNYEVGIGVFGSDALIEGTIIRNTKQGMTSMHGVGVAAQSVAAAGRANATIRSSVIQGNVTGGIFVVASDATIDTSIITDTKPNAEGKHGDGVIIQGFPETLERATAIMRSCLIERNTQIGVLVASSDAMIETSHVRDVQPNTEGAFGDGIVVLSLWSPATARLYGTLVESSARAGVSSFGGHIELDRMAVTCGTLDINGEAINGADFDFDDRGGTACGCPAATDRCHVQSSGLQPPPAIEGF